jgi:hypothetical protein
MYRRALRKKSRSESIRQSFGVVAVGALLGSGLFAIADYFTVQHWVRPATAARNAEEVNGSVLYMPQEGRNCHRCCFDNNTVGSPTTARSIARTPPIAASTAVCPSNGRPPVRASSPTGSASTSSSPYIAIGRPRDFGYSPRRPGQQVSGVLVWRSANGF